MSRYEVQSIGKLIAKQIYMDHRGDGNAATFLMQCVKGTIQYNVASPYTVSLGYVPAGATLLDLIVDVEAAFNAATTNVLIVGNASDDDHYAAAGDIDETSATRQVIPQHFETLTAEQHIIAKYTQTGTAATAGKANIALVYVV